MTKLLNLDELASDDVKIIKFKGYEHKAAVLTVQSYIDRVSRAKKVEQTDDEGSNVKRAMELVTEVFPTMTTELLSGVALQHLQVIIEFALAAPEDIERQAKAQSQAQSEAQDQGNA